MSEEIPGVMPILYNDDKWYVCDHGVHNDHEVVELVDKQKCKGATLSGPVADQFLEQFSDACLSADPEALAEFMAQYRGLMQPVRYQ